MLQTDNGYLGKRQTFHIAQPAAPLPPWQTTLGGIRAAGESTAELGTIRGPLAGFGIEDLPQEQRIFYHPWFHTSSWHEENISLKP